MTKFSVVTTKISDGTLPWTRCDAWWNTDKCRTPENWAKAAKEGIENINTTSSSLEYWE